LKIKQEIIISTLNTQNEYCEIIYHQFTPDDIHEDSWATYYAFLCDYASGLQLLLASRPRPVAGDWAKAKEGCVSNENDSV